MAIKKKLPKIGSMKKETKNLWICEGPDMVYRPVRYVPGFQKIMNELIVNAADNKRRDPKMNSLKIDIDVEGNKITVYDNGEGVPVRVHLDDNGSGEDVYLPEKMFVPFGRNYHFSDDGEKKTTGSKIGYGMALANLFSTEFKIEIADGARKKKYQQVFTDHMNTKNEACITEFNSNENWTKVVFKPDLEKFDMTHLDADTVKLINKRLIDVAGCLGETVNVEFNGETIPVKSFSDYANLYMQSAGKNRPDPLPWIIEKINDRWDICVGFSEGQFQQVSFVNGVSTIEGGTHVDYVSKQVATHIMNYVNKKNKDASLKVHDVKNHLWIFVNALIDNPEFDSPMQQTLTTPQKSFKGTCKLQSLDFLNKVAQSGLGDRLLILANLKASHDQISNQRKRILGIRKLQDANNAGTETSNECALILTEGDSAKTLVMSGIGVAGCDKYGVFPLKGKLLNVRDAKPEQVIHNSEIQHIMEIMGLKLGKKYDDRMEGLRYGHLIMLTDQDHDGSHIKALLINLIHSQWPSLLKVPSFLIEFITPILKATKRKDKEKVVSFYSMPEYESWRKSLGENFKDWDVKYYKGLGASTSKEGMEYFADIPGHTKDIVWVDEQDDEAIEMVFSKSKVEERKNWLLQYEPGTFLDSRLKEVRCSEFINKQMIQFSRADLERSIPDMVDGLKPVQRKILFCSFKCNLITEKKVARFSGYVSEHSAYHHGEASLDGTIISMAQNHVGSNNINLLQPNGQFGTRLQGGKDHAKARYIYTCLSPITRSLFPKDDDVLLNYQNEEGQSTQPDRYVPIIPTVLINGCDGVGTGWSTFIPNYNPRDIAANIKRSIYNQLMVPMDPWYKGFNGEIIRTNTIDGVTFTTKGIIKQLTSTTLEITELPLWRWTLKYKKFLDSVLTSNAKAKEPFIEDYKEHNDGTTVHFEVTLTEDNMRIAIDEGLEEKFRLISKFTTNNMHLFGPDGKIKRYDNPEEIISDFYGIRLKYYKKRKRVLVKNLESDLKQLGNKLKFILGVVEGKIMLMNRKEKELLLELQQKGFDAFPPKTKDGATFKPEDAEEKKDNSEVPDDEKVLARGYAYLLAMPLGSLTLEKVQELHKQIEKLEAELEELKNTSEKELWLKDIESFETELNEQDLRDSKAEEERKLIKDAAMNDAGASTSAPPTSSTEIDDTYEVPKSIGRAGPEKAPVKGSTEEDEAYNLDDLYDAYNEDLEITETDQDSPDDERMGTMPEEETSDSEFDPAAYNLVFSPDKVMQTENYIASNKTITEISTDDKQMKPMPQSDDECDPADTSKPVENDTYEVPKPIGRGGSEKALAKGKPKTDKDEVLDIYDILDAYNDGFSPDTVMQTENYIATNKTITEISTQEKRSDDECDPAAAAGPIGGKKAPDKPKATKPIPTARKREHFYKQTLMPDTSKPVENDEISAEKKVRKVGQSSPLTIIGERLGSSTVGSARANLASLAARLFVINLEMDDKLADEESDSKQSLQ